MRRPGCAFGYKYTRGKCYGAALSKRLACWAVEIDESFIKTDVLHFFIFREEVGDLRRDGLKSGDAGPGLGSALGHFPRSWGDRGGRWGLVASVPSAPQAGQSHLGGLLDLHPRDLWIWGRGRLLQNIPNPGTCPNLDG